MTISKSGYIPTAACASILNWCRKTRSWNGRTAAAKASPNASSINATRRNNPINALFRLPFAFLDESGAASRHAGGLRAGAARLQTQADVRDRRADGRWIPPAQGPHHPRYLPHLADDR